MRSDPTVTGSQVGARGAQQEALALREAQGGTQQRIEPRVVAGHDGELYGLHRRQRLRLAVEREGAVAFDQVVGEHGSYYPNSSSACDRIAAL